MKASYQILGNAEKVIMSKIRKELCIISMAVPQKLKEHLDKIVMLEGFDKRSDLLRRIMVEYVGDRLPAEDLAEIMSEINRIVENRL